MIGINQYISQLISLLKNSFGDRLVYVGLQGSYLRGEATVNSDIDIMVVIDGLSVADLTSYRAIIESLDYTDKSCGFICSKKDLSNWNPLEIASLVHSTKDYFGNLEDLIPVYSENDIRNFVKLSINNLYHEICHRYIHAEYNESMACLPGAYKSVFFILQNLYYLNHGVFVSTKAELLNLLDGNDYTVLKLAMDLNRGVECDFQEGFDLLFTWCQHTLESI